MMLAQFQVHYPTGSLISELVTIYQGKFVVRVAVQIEGITRATGMAAAETPELAEDRARERAIALMAIDSATPTTPEADVMSKPPLKTTLSTPQPSLPLTPTEPFNDLDYTEFLLSPPELDSVAASKNKSQKSDRVSLTPTSSTSDDSLFADFDSPPRAQTSSSNVTPFVPRSYNPQEHTNPETVKPASEPIDLSDVLAKTDIELERLRWTKEQGRDHLIRTYNKRGRSLLTDQELLGFLHYLESQPTPN